jgi:DNA primase
MPQTSKRDRREKSREHLRLLCDEIKSSIDYRAFYLSFFAPPHASAAGGCTACARYRHTHTAAQAIRVFPLISRAVSFTVFRATKAAMFSVSTNSCTASRLAAPVSELAAQLGIESNAAQPEHLPLRLRSAPDADETNSDAEPLDPSRTADICTEFVRLCAREDQSEGYGYLKRRGIGDAVIKSARVVYFPRRAYSRVMRLMTIAFDAADLRRSGLFNQREHLTFYRHRLLFPFHDGSDKNRAIYLQARTTAPGVHPRWHNMRGAVPSLYNASALAGLHDDSIVYLVEGFTDTLTLIAHNFAAIGIIGAGGLRAEWIKELARFRVVSLLDPDAAGERATARYAEMFAKEGMRLARVALPDDVNDYFRARPSAALELTLLTEAALEARDNSLAPFD